MKKFFKILTVQVFRRAFICLCTVFQLNAVPVTIISPSKITDTVFSISTPGLYVLSDDVAYSTASGTAITITTSDVTLDLNGKTIRGSNAANTAVYISAPLENITVKNGALLNFNTDILRVTTGSRTLFFEDLIISGTSNNSLTSNCFRFEGTNGSTTRTYDVFIKNCHASNARRGLLATAVDNAVLEGCTFNKNGEYVIRAINCNNWNVSNCQVSGNSRSASSESIGASVEGNAWHIKKSDFSSNVNSSRGTGLLLLGRGHIVEECSFNNNGDTGEAPFEAEGLNLAATFSSVVRNCVANGNFSVTSTAAGIRIDAGALGNSLENCIASGNRSESTTFNAYGFIIENTSSRNTLINCTAGANRSQGTGFGVGFFAASTTSNCSFKNCQSLFNTHRGFITNSTTAFLMGNLSVGHGSDANNYAGAGTFGLISVTNGAQPPTGSFDERWFDNISVV